MKGSNKAKYCLWIANNTKPGIISKSGIFWYTDRQVGSYDELGHLGLNLGTPNRSCCVDYRRAIYCSGVCLIGGQLVTYVKGKTMAL